jgi:hypothetical protein
MTEEYTCDMCANAVIDHEYFMIIKGVPITTTVIMCADEKVKDNYYNRFIKQTKVRVNSTNEPIPLIGQAHDYCRGIFFKKSETSVFETKDDDF